MRRRTIAVISVLSAGLAAAAVLFVPVLWLQLDETAVPPVSDLPALPAGVTIASDEVMCGSGGCWHQLTLSGPENQSAEELVAGVGDALGLPVSTSGQPQEACHARGLLDRRRVCTGAGVMRNEVSVYLLYERFV
ncbi:hypothetical protein V5H98_18250 [Georgenia sp. M64]|uniref:hypothetical protein n=1 Tax=Georgenia sp. M64 TaxID=3120520 RepID=UPI0030E42429